MCALCVALEAVPVVGKCRSRQSFELLDDTLTEPYRHNQRIIQGLKVVFDAPNPHEETHR